VRLRVHNNRGDCITVGTDISRRYNRSPTVAQPVIRPYSNILGTNVQTSPAALEVVSRLSFYNSSRNKLSNHEPDRWQTMRAVPLLLFLPLFHPRFIYFAITSSTRSRLCHLPRRSHSRYTLALFLCLLSFFFPCSLSLGGTIFGIPIHSTRIVDHGIP